MNFEFVKKGFLGYGGNFEKLKNPSKTPNNRKVDRVREVKI